MPEAVATCKKEEDVRASRAWDRVVSFGYRENEGRARGIKATAVSVHVYACVLGRLQDNSVQVS